jgi:hypothetical protein
LSLICQGIALREMTYFREIITLVEFFVKKSGTAGIRDLIKVIFWELLSTKDG